MKFITDKQIKYMPPEEWAKIGEAIRDGTFDADQVEQKRIKFEKRKQKPKKLTSKGNAKLF